MSKYHPLYWIRTKADQASYTAEIFMSSQKKTALIAAVIPAHRDFSRLTGIVMGAAFGGFLLLGVANTAPMP